MGIRPLMTFRMLLIFMLMFAFSLSAQNEDVSSRIARAEDLVGPKNLPGEARDLCLELIGSPDTLTPEQKLSCYTILIEAYGEQGKHQKVIETSRKLTEEKLGLPERLYADVHVAVGKSFFDKDMFENAMKEFAKVSPGEDDAAVTAYMQAQTDMAKCLKKMRRFSQMATVLTHLVEHCNDGNPRLLGVAYKLLAILYRKQGKPDRYTDAALSAYSLQSMDMREARLVQQGQEYRENYAPDKAEMSSASATKRAKRMYEELEENMLAIARRPGNKTAVAQALNRTRRIILDRIDAPEICEQMQMLRVKILAAADRRQEAISEAKLLVDVSSAQFFPGAVELLANALNSADGNQTRANAVLRYIRFGMPGADGIFNTDDDLPNPLASTVIPSSPGRDTDFLDRLTQLSDNWEGRLAKANLYRYWCRPGMALKELQHVLATAPSEKEALNDATRMALRILTTLTGDPGIVQKFIEFRRYGTDGPDELPGTPDDLKDPVARAWP